MLSSSQRLSKLISMLLLCKGFTSHQQLWSYRDRTLVNSLIRKTGNLNVTKLKNATCTFSLIRVFSVHILGDLRVSTLITLTEFTELIFYNTPKMSET